MLAMLKDPKIRRVAFVAGAGVVAAIVAGAIAFQDAFFLMSIKPAGPFATTAAPPQPDYTKAESWALRPAPNALSVFACS